MKLTRNLVLIFNFFAGLNMFSVIIEIIKNLYITVINNINDVNDNEVY